MLTHHFRSTSRFARCLGAASLLTVFAAVPALSAMAANVRTHDTLHHFSRLASAGERTRDTLHHFSVVADNVRAHETLHHFTLVASASTNDIGRDTLHHFPC